MARSQLENDAWLFENKISLSFPFEEWGRKGQSILLPCRKAEKKYWPRSLRFKAGSEARWMCGEGRRETVSCLEKGTQTPGNKDRSSWDDLGMTILYTHLLPKLFGDGLFVPRPEVGVR